MGERGRKREREREKKKRERERLTRDMEEIVSRNLCGSLQGFD